MEGLTLVSLFGSKTHAETGRSSTIGSVTAKIKYYEILNLRM